MFPTTCCSATRTWAWAHHLEYRPLRRIPAHQLTIDGDSPQSSPAKPPSAERLPGVAAGAEAAPGNRQRRRVRRHPSGNRDSRRPATVECAPHQHDGHLGYDHLPAGTAGAPRTRPAGSAAIPRSFSNPARGHRTSARVGLCSGVQPPAWRCSPSRTGSSFPLSAAASTVRRPRAASACRGGSGRGQPTYRLGWRWRWPFR